jgi:hypothetical protein
MTKKQHGKIKKMDELDYLLNDLSFSMRIESLLEFCDSPNVNYSTSYRGYLYSSDGTLDRSQHEAIGTVNFTILRLEEAERDGIKTDAFLDDCSVFELGKILEKGTVRLNPKFKATLPLTVTHPDVLVIREMEILPSFRGVGIGIRLIYLLLFHFKNSCGLLMLPVKPYQLTPYFLHISKEKTFMQYELFVKDPELAFLKQMAYFIKMGFKVASGFDDSLLYICTQEKRVRPKDFHIT